MKKNDLIIRGNGKVLLCGEYVVMDGAHSLALPSRYGQSMAITFEKEPSESFEWISLDMYHEVWFETTFTKSPLACMHNGEVADLLKQILSYISESNKAAFNDFKKVIMKADYPLQWGLGSSSTLIYCLAAAFQMDAYAIQEQFLGGSGYDIACASVKGPIVFQRLSTEERRITESSFAPARTEQWAFVYLGKKQHTRKAIAHYKQQGNATKELIDAISAISLELSKERHCSAEKAIVLLKEHEQRMSEALQIPTIQSERFADFNGVVKSLGAWGGDFVLAISSEEKLNESYFYEKGYPIVIPYQSLVIR